MFKDIDTTKKRNSDVSRVQKKEVTTPKSFREGIGHSFVLKMKIAQNE